MMLVGGGWWWWTTVWRRTTSDNSVGWQRQGCVLYVKCTLNQMSISCVTVTVFEGFGTRYLLNNNGGIFFNGGFKDWMRRNLNWMSGDAGARCACFWVNRVESKIEKESIYHSWLHHGLAHIPTARVERILLSQVEGPSQRLLDVSPSDSQRGRWDT